MHATMTDPQGRSGLSASLTTGVFAAAAAVGGSFAPEPYTLPAVGGSAFLAVSVIGTLALRRRIGRVATQLTTAAEAVAAARQDLTTARNERAVLRELGSGLDRAENESEALAVLDDVLTHHLPHRSTELHLVDPVDPVLTLVSETGTRDRNPGQRTSPWDSLAARDNTVLVHETTDHANVCSHLKDRCTEPVAALALPVTVTGRLLGVLYVFADEGTVFEPTEIALAEDLATTVAARFAVLRSAARPDRTETVDRLTGLPDRDAMQTRVIRLLEDRYPFTVAVADIDGFSALNETQGRDAGDRVLQTTARVSRRTVRPVDLVGRIGGDEFLFVFPRTDADDASRALERLREELVLELSTGDDPTFTLSIGVIASDAAATIEDVLRRAAEALHHARRRGGNRVVVAQTAAPRP